MPHWEGPCQHSLAFQGHWQDQPSGHWETWSGRSGRISLRLLISILRRRIIEPTIAWLLTIRPILRSISAIRVSLIITLLVLIRHWGCLSCHLKYSCLWLSASPQIWLRFHRFNLTIAVRWPSRLKSAPLSIDCCRLRLLEFCCSISKFGISELADCDLT